ncbi:MAG TPA: S41 family peptidase [Chitinophagaceae bacterium]|nr:S41 family peptidase [Chitinophagaceae bacterium]
MIRIVIFSSLILSATSCSVPRSSYSPLKKYSPEQLHKDYTFFRGVLEESHPGLYWYSSKEEMDRYFDWGENQLRDSLTEPRFRNVLSYVAAKINCGHTVVQGSKAFSRFRDTGITKVFPLSLKLWSDSSSSDVVFAAVAANLIRNDSLLKRGVEVKKINGWSIPVLTDTLCQYISSDGYNLTHKYQTLSNRGGFGSAYTSIFGVKENYFIDYTDSCGEERSVVIPAYNPRADSLARSSVTRFRDAGPYARKKLIRQSARSFRIDSSNLIGIMDLNSFGRRLHLKSFIKTSFRSMRQRPVSHLVLDVRGNGGGSVSNSTLLTRFIINRKFKVADSLFAKTINSRYKKNIENYFFTRLFMQLMTSKKKDGRYHFGFFERHYFKPKKKNHFDGQVYIITGGNSFSATTLFAQTVKNQDNVILVGEETGGGAYGNNAWLIPDVTLPVTGVRFRLPLFRLVLDKNIPKDGRGVQPEIESKPTVDAIRRGIDYKAEKVMELIRKNQ